MRLDFILHSQEFPSIFFINNFQFHLNWRKEKESRWDIWVYTVYFSFIVI